MPAELAQCRDREVRGSEEEVPPRGSLCPHLPFPTVSSLGRAGSAAREHVVPDTQFRFIIWAK